MTTKVQDIEHWQGRQWTMGGVRKRDRQKGNQREEGRRSRESMYTYIPV